MAHADPQQAGRQQGSKEASRCKDELIGKF